MKATLLETNGRNEHNPEKIESIVECINGALEVSGADSDSAFVALILTATRLLERSQIQAARDKGHDVPDNATLSGHFSTQFGRYQVEFSMQPSETDIVSQINDAVLRHNMRCDCAKAKQWRLDNGIPDPDKRN